MNVLIDLNNKKRNTEKYLLEFELQNKIIENWDCCFPNFKFIAKEFILSGDVRHVNRKGRIDILALNKTTNRFVIFELKKDFDVNIRSQAFDYVDYFMDHKHEMYLKSSQYVLMPAINTLNIDNVEIVLIAKHFKNSDVNLAKNDINLLLTIISYSYFEKNQLCFNIFEKENKIIKPKNIIHSMDYIAIFWDAFTYLYNNHTININENFKIIESFGDRTLYINIPSIYEKYVVTCKERYLTYLDINNLRDVLKAQTYYKGIIKSTKIGKMNSSAFMFDLNLMKHIVEF